MKNVFIFISLFIFNNVFSQPLNDNQSNATNIGSLPIPGTCTSGIQNGTQITINNQSTQNATTENPSIYISNCNNDPSNHTPPGKDVWYKLTCTGTIINISVTGFNNVYIGLYQLQDNGTLLARNCSFNTGLMSTVSCNPGKIYLVQIASVNSSETDDDFSLSIDNDIDCNDCVMQAQLTVNPLPVNGFYNPSQQVEFCYHIDLYSQQNTNWLHGVQINFNDGWDESSIIPLSVPTYLSNTGTWNWYNSCTSSSSSTTYGKGFYFDRDNDGNPGNNFGDGATSSTTPFSIPADKWNFCWKINVSTNLNISSLKVVINTTADGETGSWSNVGCNDDDSLIFNLTKYPLQNDTCNGLNASKDSSNALCFGDANAYAKVTVSGGTKPFIYSWNIGGNDSTLSQISSGTYTCTITDSIGCSIIKTFNLTQPSQLITNINSDQNSTCINNHSNFSNITSGGTGSYNFLWNNNSTSTVTSYFLTTDTTIYLTVSDQNNCIAKDSISLIPGNSSIIGTIELIGSQAIPRGDLYLFNAGQGHLLDTIAIININTNFNTFSFDNIPSGNYLILYRPTGNGLNSAYCFGSTTWDSSYVINFDCNSNDTIKIYTWADSVGIGNGNINGYVFQGVGFGNKMYNSNQIQQGILNARAILYNSNYILPISERYTDSSGFFEFKNIDTGYYKVLIDIPGLKLDSFYQVHITDENLNFTNLNFEADSNSIYIVPQNTTTINENNKIEFLIFPNPVNDFFNLYSNQKFNQIIIYSLTGSKVMDYSFSPTLNKIIKTQSIDNGIYFVEIKNNSSIITKIHIVITH